MNNILNKIAQMERNAEEVNLASHKVELGALDEIQGWLEKSKRDIPTGLNKVREAKDIFTKTLNGLESMDKEFEKAESMIKLLGIETPQELKKYKSEHSELKNALSKSIDALTSAIKM